MERVDISTDVAYQVRSTTKKILVEVATPIRTSGFYVREAIPGKLTPKCRHPAGMKVTEKLFVGEDHLLTDDGQVIDLPGQNISLKLVEVMDRKRTSMRLPRKDVLKSMTMGVFQHFVKTKGKCCFVLLRLGTNILLSTLVLPTTTEESVVGMW